MKATFYLKSGNKCTVRVKYFRKNKNVDGSVTYNWGHTLPKRFFDFDDKSIEVITFKYSLFEIIESWFKKGK